MHVSSYGSWFDPDNLYSTNCAGGSAGGNAGGNSTNGTGGGGNLTLTVNVTSLAHSGDWVTVTWKNVHNPNSSDWIGVYLPTVSGTIDAKNHAPYKFKVHYIISGVLLWNKFLSTSFGCLLWRGINLRECRKQSKLSFGKALQRGTAQVPSTSFLAWSLILQLCSCIWKQSIIGHALVAQNYDRTWIAKVEHVYFSLEKQG